MAMRTTTDPGTLGAQLKRARQCLRLSLEDAGELAGLGASVLEQWEIGSSAPELEQLWELAEVYGRPMSYFASVTSDPPAAQDFRMARGITEPINIESLKVIVARFDELCRSWAMFDAPLSTQQKLAIEKLRDSKEVKNARAETAAQFVRQQLGLDSQPAKPLRPLLEKSGVRIFGLAVSMPQFAGSSWWHPDCGPAILVNSRGVEGRQNFTVCHELAHLLRSHGQAICAPPQFFDAVTPSSTEERFADEFAVEFLMPKADVYEIGRLMIETGELRGGETADSALDKLERRYGASREALAWRLEHLELLPAGFTSKKKEQWSTRWFKGSRGRRWRGRLRNLGGAYVGLVQQNYRTGALSLNAAADLLGLDPQEAQEWANPTKRSPSQ